MIIALNMLLSLASTSDVTATSSGPCIRHCLRQTLRVCVFILFIFIVVDATPHFLDEDSLDLDTMVMPDKRPARLSYFRAPYSRGYSRGRYESRGRYGYGNRSYRGGYGNYDWWRKKAVNRYYNMPWEALPNTNCLRKFCRRDTDCCRRYSKCHEQAHVCYDCWYGHPCNVNKDCCERYPHCNTVLHTCGN